jgi:flagellar basal-body rod modification protein FlgD
MERELSLATAGITTKRDYDESQLVKAVGEDDLDRNAFLQLLTTQLQNQNPLDPMKNEAFVAQLAQFSQLEGITNMSTSLDEVTDVMKSDRIMTGANLVGKSVVAATGRITTDGESPASIELALPYGADQVDFGIYDTDTGNLVRSIVVGPQSSGNLKVQWDGQLADGNQATPGIYEIRAKVIRDGASQSQVPQTFSRVETVSWDALNSNLNLNLAGGVSLPMSQVTRVGESVISNSKTTDTSGE